MPAIPQFLGLSLADIPPVIDYLENAAHPNHDGYRIVGPSGPSPSIADFTTKVSSDWSCIVVTNPTAWIAVRWIVIRFAPGSHLGDGERCSYDDMACDVLGRKVRLRWWHIFERDGPNEGSSDLNILDPAIAFGVVPRLDQNRYTNILYRLRQKSDEWTARANHARKATGLAPIPAIDPLDPKTASALGRLAKLMLENIHQKSDYFYRRQIPEVLAKAGFSKADWRQDFAGNLMIRRWPVPEAKADPKKESREVKIRVDDLSNLICLEVLRRSAQRRRKEAEAELEERHRKQIEQEELRLLRTANTVIQPEPEIDL